MEIAESKITSQGQISVPTLVRRLLGLEPGSVIEWHEQEGEIIVRRAAKYSSEDIHKKVFCPVSDGAGKTVAEMDEGIRRRMKRKYECS